LNDTTVSTTEKDTVFVKDTLIPKPVIDTLIPNPPVIITLVKDNSLFIIAGLPDFFFYVLQFSIL